MVIYLIPRVRQTHVSFFGFFKKFIDGTLVIWYNDIVFKKRNADVSE